MSDYEIKMLNRPVLIKIVKEQQEIINKAIEYINTHYLNANEPELLNILKGENNEYNK